jgi:hypothetical protein
MDERKTRDIHRKTIDTDDRATPFGDIVEAQGERR